MYLRKLFFRIIAVCVFVGLWLAEGVVRGAECKSLPVDCEHMLSGGTIKEIEDSCRDLEFFDSIVSNDDQRIAMEAACPMCIPRYLNIRKSLVVKALEAFKIKEDPLGSGVLLEIIRLLLKKNECSVEDAGEIFLLHEFLRYYVPGGHHYHELHPLYQGIVDVLYNYHCAA